VRLLLALLLLLPGLARAANIASQFYEGRAYVTGTRAETRSDALMTAFRRVLVKVSGNPVWFEADRVSVFAPLLPGMTLDIAYLDRLSDEPHHDEQGTRDRPFDLIAHFDPPRIDAVLTLLGDRPWETARPRIALNVTIDNHGIVFPLTADADASERHRQALLAAADRFGVQVVLGLENEPPPTATLLIEGHLAWSDTALGWVADWHSGGMTWSVSGVSFDEAYRAALSHVAARLSGHS